ncbi:MAG: hypothetical protein ACYDBV_01680 [Nitrospiria bacterium]
MSAKALENNGLIKIYGFKNRAVSVTGIFVVLFLSYLLLNEISHLRLFKFHSFSQYSLSGPIFHFKLTLIGFGVVAAFVILLISYIPNIIITEKQIKIGWKFGGPFGLTRNHLISWDQIVQIDSGGSKLIQWSPDTSIFYHTGKIPVGYSSDIAKAVISTGLGYQNYCNILKIVLQKAPKARVDGLTLRLMKGCQNTRNPRS